MGAGFVEGKVSGQAVRAIVDSGPPSDYQFYPYNGEGGATSTSSLLLGSISDVKKTVDDERKAAKEKVLAMEDPVESESPDI